MKEDSVVNWLDSARVKILLLPLSEFPDNNFGEYLKRFEEFNHLNLSTLPSIDSNDIILKKLGSGGTITYNFITSIDPNSNDFIDFQLHQRIFGVLGIIHGPSHKKTKEEIDEVMQRLKDDFKYEIATEVFVFDSNELKYYKNVTKQEDFQKEMNHFASRIVFNMSELFNDINQRPAIHSPCGIEDYSGTASRSSSSKTKMRLSGRVQKLLADLHLLTGSFSEAVAGYVSASEDARIANDSIWSAAAQEGFNTALCLQNEQLVTDDKSDIYKLLIDKLTPLAVIYERSGTPILSIELQITCSRIHRFIKQGTAALTVLGEAWKSCNLLSFDEKMVAYSRVLKEFASAGNWRKWSLYTVQMAQMLKLAQKPEIALLTLSKTLPIYNLTQSKEYHKIQGWPSVQSALLKEMIKLSENHSNRLLNFLYGWMYLVHSSRCQDTADQVQIIESLRKKSMRDMFSLNYKGESNSEFVCSLPIFVKLEVQNGNDGKLFVSERNNTSSTSGPFIYNPNMPKTKNNTASTNTCLTLCDSLICGEPATFKLILSNPFVFPIILKNIYLITDDSSNDSKLSEQVSITLPPLTKDRTVLINLVPKQSGPLIILGFCATFMNVEIQFLINSQGKILEEAKDSNFDLGIELNVIEPHPILQCASDALKKGLQLYEGESIEVPLTFTNINETSSKFEISMINFKIIEEQKISTDSEFEINEIIFENDQQATFKIESDEFDKMLPISREFQVPLKIYGTHNGCIKSACLEVLYSTSSSLSSSDKIYWRKLSFPLSVTICSIIKIEQFSFYPCVRTKNLLATTSVLSKFGNIEGDEKDFCIGSFIIYNLESCFTLNICIEISNFPFKFEEILSNQSAKRIFFIIPRLKKTLEMKMTRKLPLTEKKIAAVRKLRRPGVDDFLDDTFEDFLYDHSQFWIKNYLIDNLKIQWNSSDDREGRKGKVSLAQCHVPAVYYDSIFKNHFTIIVDCNEFKNIPIGQEIILKFTICPEEGKHDFKLKLFPVVILSDKEVGQNFDRVLKYSGCLDSFVKDASPSSPQIRTFKFYPISTATVKIIYQVVDLETQEIHWCESPILIETTTIE